MPEQRDDARAGGSLTFDSRLHACFWTRTKTEHIRTKHKQGSSAMLGFLKDAMALVSIIGFTAASLTWVDMASRLV
jgi:hypothetical protein